MCFTEKIARDDVCSVGKKLLEEDKSLSTIILFAVIKHISFFSFFVIIFHQISGVIAPPGRESHCPP